MSEPKRLHPIASVLTTGKRMRNLLIPMIALTISGGRDGRISLLISLILSFVLIIITLFTGILSWLRYTYRFEQDELRMEYGIFIRKKRYIPFERIQSIDLTEGLLQRLFGLVKVKIETAGEGDEAEAVLSAITKKEAQVIQEYITAAKGDRVKEDVLQGHQPIYKISTQQLLLLSLTSGGIGVVISGVLALLSQLDDFIPYKKLFGGLENWNANHLIFIAIVVFLGFFLAWIIALIMTIMKYANFTVVKTEKNLIISQGLLERRQMTIPLGRIQAITISENLLRQMLGYGTVFVESAGGSSANEEGANVMLLPLVKVKQIRTLVEPYLPDYCLTTSFAPVPKRALRRYLFRSWSIVVPIVVISLLFLKVWGLLSLILLGLVTLRAVLKYKAAGWSLNKQQLSLRYRTSKRTTVFLKKNKIQSLQLRESYFQRKQELGTLEAFAKSGSGDAGGAVIDMEKSDMEKIYDWFSRGKPNRDRSES